MSYKRFWSTLNHIVSYLLYAGLAAYFVFSIVEIAKNAYILGVWGVLVNIIALILEVLGFFYALYFAVQLIDGVLQVGEKPYDLSKVTGKTKVSVIIPIHNVNPEVLRETLEGFKQQTYKNFDVWVADDSTDVELREKCKNICDELNENIIYYYEPNDRFKAHMLNIVIPKTDGELIALFDVDHVPKPDILEKFVAILEQYPEYVFVQAKFGFRNAKNLLHIWAAMGLVQSFCSQNARRVIGTVLFSGSSACFRREYIYPVPEGKMTEDFDHTISLILEGKKGYWLDELAAMSLVPETMGHQMSQSYRWMAGETGIMYDHGWRIIKNLFKGKIGLRQAVDVVLSSTLVLVATSFYFLSIFYAILYLANIPLIRAFGLGIYWLVIIVVFSVFIYFATVTATTIYTMKSDTVDLKLWHVPFFLTFGSFTAPFLIIPAISGIIGKNKLIPGKTQWNKRFPMYKWAAFFTIIGAFYIYLTIKTLLSMNYYFLLFGMVGITLVLSLPFTYITHKAFKSEIFEEKHIYH